MTDIDAYRATTARPGIGPRPYDPSPLDRDALREQWRLAALEWSRIEDAASRLEEGRQIVLAEEVLALVEAGEPITRAEKIARTSERWKSYVRTMHDARKAANDARIERDNRDRIYWAHAAQEANARAEMKLTGR